jgi:soluble P-type ATPase
MCASHFIDGVVMIEIVIPGGATLKIEHLVLDYNGTLALDGELISGVLDRLKSLASSVQLHVLTADTYGTVREKVDSINCLVRIIGEGEQDKLKAKYLNSLGPDSTMAIGNGRNDALMP